MRFASGGVQVDMSSVTDQDVANMAVNLVYIRELYIESASNLCSLTNAATVGMGIHCKNLEILRLDGALTLRILTSELVYLNLKSADRYSRRFMSSTW